MDLMITGIALIMPITYGFSLLFGLIFNPPSDNIHD